MTENDVEQEDAGSSRKVQRSPAYPFIPLEKAIQRARELYSKEGRNGARYPIVVKHWGFQAKSSGALQTLAALRQYGLVLVENGTGDDRVVRVTDRAIKILIDQREDEQLRAVQDAALSPKLYRSLWDKWKSDLPSDANAESHLAVDLDFNPSTVKGVLQSYKDTLAYAKLLNGASLSDQPPDLLGQIDEEQGEMLGTQEQTATAPQRPVPPPASPAKHAGEEEYLRAKLSGGRTVRVLFTGPDEPTSPDIRKLIKLLELLTDNQSPNGQDGSSAK